MQVAQKATSRRISMEAPAVGRVSALNMYMTPPTESISVTEFEEFAFDRLRCALAPLHHQPRKCCLSARAPSAVLSTIDMARAKGTKGQQLTGVINKAIRDYMPNTPTGIKKDVYSHFILRLAYCRRCVASQAPAVHVGTSPPCPDTC